jgi:carbonic anhydrase
VGLRGTILLVRIRVAPLIESGAKFRISFAVPFAFQPAVDQAGANLVDAIKANAKIHAALLRQASPVLAGLIKEKKLDVVAAYYDLGSGEVSIID